MKYVVHEGVVPAGGGGLTLEYTIRDTTELQTEWVWNTQRNERHPVELGRAVHLGGTLSQRGRQDYRTPAAL